MTMCSEGKVILPHLCSNPSLSCSPGNVWIYSIYEPNYDLNATATAGPYCNQNLYLFAFGTTTTYSVLLSVLLIVYSCIQVVHWSRRRESDPLDDL